MRRLAQKLHERVHALVGVGEQHFPFAHLVDDGALAVQAGRPLGRERRVHQGCALLFGQAGRQRVGVAHVERHRGHERLVLFEVQPLHQQRPYRIGQLALAFQPHRGKARALLQDALHVLAVVLVGFVGAYGGIQVGVARDADDVGVLDGVHGEYLGRHHLDGVFQQDELQAAARQLDDALALAGQGDQPQRHAFRPQVLRGLGLLGGRLFGLALVLVGLGVGRVLAALRGLALALGAACRAGARVRAAGGVGFLVQPHHQVQRAVFQVGEGVAGVDDLRRKEGQHVCVHVVAQEGALLVVQVVGAQMAHVGLL